MPFTIRGPKGGLIVRSASAARVKTILAGLRKRFGKVTVTSIASPDGHAHEVRARIVWFCRWGCAHEPQIHYAETRQIPGEHAGQVPRLPFTTDCSGFATMAYRYAGAPDPNGNNYNGQGYTGTLLDHCRHIPKEQAQPGDLAVFGPKPGHHVVVLLQPGTANDGDPVVASHGQEKGPVALRLSTEAAYQPSPVTFLTCLD